MRNLLPLHLPTTIGGAGNYHHQQQHHQMPIETSGTPYTVAELSEAECDIDTIKKLKIGMRSSLWLRPNVAVINNQPTLAVSSQNGGGGGGGIGPNGLNNAISSVALRQPIEPTSNPSDYSIAV